MGMRRVEVLGPSGVGKSTVLNAVVRRRSQLRSGGWAFPEDLTATFEELRKGATGGERLTQSLDSGIDDAFFRACFDILARSRMRPSQRFSAIAMVRRSCEDLHDLSHLPADEIVVHDELLLHRAFSVLPRSSEMPRDARIYFETVPVPEYAFILKAEAGVIHDRVLGRSRRPNCYRGIEDPDLTGVIEQLLEACDIAAEVLPRRGVEVHVLDANRPLREVGQQMVDILNSIPHSKQPGAESLVERVLDASGSFRKKDGRYRLKQQRVAYCSFSTPALTVPPEISQRDSVRRLTRLGLVRSEVEGCSVLDLGCNSGAMLFELTNRGIGSGLGVEYDGDKIELARDIAALSGLQHLEFRQADIDSLTATELGQFDIVLAFAIEAHVMDPEKLLEVITSVTRSRLYFEGNGGCDIESVGKRLLELGFAGVAHLGYCDDDSRPSNNNRPLLKAWKVVEQAT